MRTMSRVETPTELSTRSNCGSLSFRTNDLKHVTPLGTDLENGGVAFSSSTRSPLTRSVKRSVIKCPT